MTTKPRYYVLDGHEPRPVSDVLAWARFFENLAARIVAKTLIGDVEISTVFLGLDHQLDDGPPLLFESMIFGGKHDQWVERCSTWRQAEAQHEKACALVRSDLQ